MKLRTNVILIGLVALAIVGWAGVETKDATVTETHVGAQEAQKAVLVTGASSGIGRKITEHLAAGGYFVYAGARSADDLRELNAIENVQSIRLERKPIEELVQLNEGHTYTYDRASLIAMLDEALAASGR